MPFAEDLFLDKKTGSKIKKIIKITVIVVLLLQIIIYNGARLYFSLPVKDYYGISEREFQIPGLSQKMVPQGLAYLDDGTFLIGGYQSNGAPSRIYRFDSKRNKEAGYVVLGDENGTPVAPHAGGLAVHGAYVYVTGEDACIYIYSLSEVESGESGKTLSMKGRIHTTFGDDKIEPAWICITEDRLITGEFYREPNYPTPDSHIFTGPSGEQNHALALSYKLNDPNGPDFSVEAVPSKIYSIPGLVQGMAVKDGKFWISQSWGVAKSTIRCYDVSGSEKTGTMKTGIHEIPVYTFDSSTQVTSFDAPPMAEEMVFVDGRLYIMSESASGKYFFGKLTGGKWCYSTDVSRI